MKLEMGLRDVLMYVLTGIKAGRYNAAQKLLEDVIESLDDKDADDKDADESNDIDLTP